MNYNKNITNIPYSLLLRSWKSSFSGAEIEDLHRRFRPTPRLLNEIADSGIPTKDFLQQYERKAMGKATTILEGATVTLTDENFLLDTSHTIAVLRPVATNDQDRFVSVSAAYRMTIPTTYLFQLISRAAASINREKSKHFFRMVRSSGETGGLAGMCFESYVRARLSACEDEAVICKSLSSGSNQDSHPFAFVFGKGTISYTDANDLSDILATRNPMEFEKTRVFTPVQKNFPSLDFLFFEHIPGDKGRKPALQANLLQVNVSPTHSIKAIGIVLVANAIPLELQDFSRYPPRLITLVPDVMDFRKSPQDVERPLKSSKDASVVKAAE